jgi:hypothetical protein
VTDRVDVVRKEGYLHLTAHGSFSLDGGRHTLDAVAAACAQEDCDLVLLDCRSLEGELPVMDRFDVAEYGASAVPHSIKIAVLAQEEQILSDRFFENVARNRGLTLSMFSDPDEALEWLQG